MHQMSKKNRGFDKPNAFPWILEVLQVHYVLTQPNQGIPSHRKEKKSLWTKFDSKIEKLAGIFSTIHRPVHRDEEIP